jgi:HlyD family secretion protein
MTGTTNRWLPIVWVAALTGAACGADSGDDASVDGPPADVSEVVGPGRVEPHGGMLELGTDQSGRVAHLWVAAGDTVAAGESLVELEQAVEAARVARADAEVAAAEARLQVASAATRAQRLSAAQAARELARAEVLAAAGVSTTEVLEQARTREETLAAGLEEAEAQEALARAEVASARSALALAEAELGLRAIRAPVEGIVYFVGVDEGTVLNGFQAVTVVEMAARGPMRVIAEIDELFADRVRLGRQARIVDPGTGREVASGPVVFVAPSLRRKSLLDDAGGTFEDRRVREVRVRLDENAPLLPGARVEVRIEVGGV